MSENIVVMFPGLNATQVPLITGVPYIKAGDKVVRIQATNENDGLVDRTGSFGPVVPLDNTILQMPNQNLSGLVFLATIKPNSV